MSVDVIDDELGEAIGVVQVRLVARSGEDHEATAFQGGVSIASVRDRDHRISISPDDQHATAIKQVQLVQCGDALTRGTHHAAQSREEGRAPVGLAEP